MVLCLLWRGQEKCGCTCQLPLRSIGNVNYLELTLYLHLWICMCIVCLWFLSACPYPSRYSYLSLSIFFNFILFFLSFWPLDPKIRQLSDFTLRLKRPYLLIFEKEKNKRILKNKKGFHFVKMCGLGQFVLIR